MSETIPEEREHVPSGEPKEAPMVFSPTEQRLAEDSPQPYTPHEAQRSQALAAGTAASVPMGASHTRENAPLGQVLTAPGEMYNPHRKISLIKKGPPAETFDLGILRHSAVLKSPHLDPEAPLRAVRDQAARGSSKKLPTMDGDGVKRLDTMPPAVGFRHTSAPPDTGTSTTRAGSEANIHEQDTARADAAGEGAGSGEWGTPFKVQWIRVGKLPFNRTRHLRNPWNHDREVKVSRDGTELEPTLGQALLDEWDKPEPVTSSMQSPTAARRAGARGLPRTGHSETLGLSQRMQGGAERGGGIGGDGVGRGGGVGRGHS